MLILKYFLSLFLPVDYLKLLSRLGPLVSPLAIYPTDCFFIDLPNILTTSDEGLGLNVATSPLSVINYWIAPHQSDFKLASTEDADWFIAAAQLIIFSGQLDETLISHLPIVCQARNSVKLFNSYTDVAFMPPMVLKNPSEAEEYEIISQCAKNMIDENILFASSDYFNSCVSPQELDSLCVQSRWHSLFSIAGKHSSIICNISQRNNREIYS